MGSIGNNGSDNGGSGGRLASSPISQSVAGGGGTVQDEDVVRVEEFSAPTTEQLNMRCTGVKRLLKEAVELRHANEMFCARPMEDNLFEWHFSVRGPPDSPYAGGTYHGRIVLPADYPMKPPNLILLTPNGRFETNKKICLSISGYHPETWLPSWSIRTALLALVGFMPTHSAGALGGLECSREERRRLAIKSLDWRCATCGVLMRDALPPAPPPPVAASATASVVSNGAIANSSSTSSSSSFPAPPPPLASATAAMRDNDASSGTISTPPASAVPLLPNNNSNGSTPRCGGGTAGGCRLVGASPSTFSTCSSPAALSTVKGTPAVGVVPPPLPPLSPLSMASSSLSAAARARSRSPNSVSSSIHRPTHRHRISVGGGVGGAGNVRRSPSSLSSFAATAPRITLPLCIAFLFGLLLALVLRRLDSVGGPATGR